MAWGSEKVKSSTISAPNLLARAEERRRRGLDLIETLGLMERWSRYGSPVLVGAVNMGLVVALDIDINVYSDEPRIEHGFEVMSEVALLPGVWKICFSNELAGPDAGLYWQIRCRDKGGNVWKIDNWLISWDHPDAGVAEHFASAMQQALTEETRAIILAIKEQLKDEHGVDGIDIYRAVLEGGVSDSDQFIRWIAQNKTSGVTRWRPSV